MQDVAAEIDRSCIVSILPYRLKALKRRQQAARAAVFAVASPVSVPAARLSSQESGVMRTGIRHIASGRMTVTHARLNTVMSMLTEHTAGRRGLLEDPRLEAILVDGQREVFAGFWP
jgi:acetyl-CoA acetyltransferase